MSDRTQKRWIAEGVTVRRQPGVVAPAAAPATREQQLMAALLSAGSESAVSHRAAAAEWGIDACGAALVELTIPRLRNHPPRGAIVHRLTDLVEPHVTTRNGYRITTPARTLVDAGAVLPMWMVDRATGRAISDKLCTEAEIEAVLAVVGRRGRTGAGVMREVLGGRAPSLIDGSELERRFAQLLADHGLPTASFQYEVSRHGVRMFIDAAFPLVKFAIEVDGYRWHRTREQLQNDDERQNLLVELGWTVLRFTWDDIVNRPAATAARIRRVLERLSANSG